MLILTEKSSVARDFAAALDAKERRGHFEFADGIITYCKGHLFELLMPEDYDPKYKKWSLSDLPIIPDEFRYSKVADSAAQTKIVLEKLREHASDKIVVATDADREGELIARIVLDQAGITDLSNCWRFWVSEALTPEVVLEGLRMARPLSEYDGLAEQAYARQRADWLVGMNFTRFVSVGNPEVFSVGRVQTAVLCEIARRNHEVKNFVPSPYSELEATVRDPSGISMTALLVNPADGKTAFDADSRFLRSAAEGCRGKRIESVSRDSVLKTLKPGKLLNIDALEKEAFRRFGYAPEDTLNTAEELYADLKCLSYPRTPSRVMGDSNVDLFREKFDLLRDSYPELSRFCNPRLITPDNKHIFDSSDLESHHALIPLARIPDDANERQRNVFGIVVEGFFRSCMDDHKFQEMTLNFKCGGFTFRAVARKTVQKGWRAYEERRNVTATAEGGEDAEPQEAGEFSDDGCVVADTRTQNKETSPKKEYSIDTLLMFMEKPRGGEDERLVGLGTPAKRADIVKKLFDVGYVTEERKKLHATKKGLWLLTFLSKDRELAKVANVSQTTRWERELAENPVEFERHIRQYVSDSINPGIKEVYVKESPGKCPLCGRDVIEQKNSWSCSGWDGAPPCRFSIWKTAFRSSVSFEDARLLLAGKCTAAKTCKKKDGGTFRAQMRLDGTGNIELVFQKKRKQGEAK